MIVSRIRDTGIHEPCPTTSLAGFYEPTAQQLEVLFARDGDGKLNPSLQNDSLVRWGDAVGTLATAALFAAIARGLATAAWAGRGDDVVAIALADLAVTGATNFADFRRAAGRGVSLDIPALRERVAGELPLAAARQSAFLTADADALRPVVDRVVDRALEVVWALHGPAEHRIASRPALGWIAVNAERDPPLRPVNVPSTPWPTGDLDIVVDHARRSLSCRIRYAIGGASDASTTVSVLDGMPNEWAVPAVPRDALVLLFLHGHSSRLEEGGELYRALVERVDDSCLAQPLVMIALDFPTNGYSEYFDHELISPLASTTRFVPDRPLERRFGLLEYYERVVVAFVDELERRTALAGVPGVRDRIAAVIGGSMGGNLALRLSERLVTSTEWLGGLVAWSPASVYGSFGRADYLIPSPGEHVDPIAKEALERPHDRCRDAESDGSRGDFIRLLFQGERLVNDGTTEFEVGVRFLEFLGLGLVGGLFPLIAAPLGPVLSGLVGPLVLGTGIALESEVFNIVAIKQSDEWLRPECRAGFDTAEATRGALLVVQETYNDKRRRMHWRIAYEQLLFSHQDEIAASRGVPCYAASEIPTLLIAGADDVVDESRFNIFGGVEFIAPRMEANPGRALLVDDTGHSIHAERPRWLARQIYRFVCELRPPTRVIAVQRDADGRITHLVFGPPWRPVSVDGAIRRALNVGGRTPYYVEDDEGRRTPIFARRYLATRPDETIDNNLRSLPRTTLPAPEEPVRGPAEGFRVTHIRVRDGDPAMPWTSWVTHLCNDAEGHQASNFRAEWAVDRGEARYTIGSGADETELVLVQYLTTHPDDSTENNLSSLPDA